MRKSDGVGIVQTFPTAQFLCVVPPIIVGAKYDTDQSDTRWLPTCLHDSDGRLQEPLTEAFPVETFVSADYSRYFRLYPALVESLEDVRVTMEKDFNAEVSVVRAYETAAEPHKLHHYGQVQRCLDTSLCLLPTLRSVLLL